MKTTFNFETNDTKILLAKLDFEFFLKQHISIEQYQQEDIECIYIAYKRTSAIIKANASGRKRQFNYYAEGQVRKMFTGGFLPGHFELDDSRRNRIIDYSGAGESWAYFDYWQKYQKRKITKEKVWDFIIKTGSILALLLSILKLLEYVKENKT
jgi:hypothetical protein